MGLNHLLRVLFTSFAVVNYDYDNNDDDALNIFLRNCNGPCMAHIFFFF